MLLHYKRFWTCTNRSKSSESCCGRWASRRLSRSKPYPRVVQVRIFLAIRSHLKNLIADLGHACFQGRAQPCRMVTPSGPHLLTHPGTQPQ